jgi:rhamnosyl/mannosyltransferase
LAELASLFTPFSPPIVVHWHSRIVAQKKLKWLVAPLSYILMMRAKAVIVTSNRMIEQSFLLRCFRRKITVIPYGLPPIGIDGKDKAEDKGYFMLIGRHVSYKGIDVAIKALVSCQAKLVIIGQGPLMEKHRRLAERLNVSNRIQFKPDAEDDAVEQLLRNATALIVPSVLENEAFALVQIEAMRLAKPIINTDLKSSVPWVARDNKEAITVPPSDVPALTAAMKNLMCNQELKTRLGNNGLLRFQAHFTKDKFARALQKVYSHVADN